MLAGACVGGGTTVNWTASFRTPKHVLHEWGQRFKLTSFQSESQQGRERERRGTGRGADAHDAIRRADPRFVCCAVWVLLGVSGGLALSCVSCVCCGEAPLYAEAMDAVCRRGNVNTQHSHRSRHLDGHPDLVVNQNNQVTLTQ